LKLQGKLSFHGENYGKSSTLLSFSVELPTTTKTTTSTTTTSTTTTTEETTTETTEIMTTTTNKPVDPLDYLSDFYDSFIQQINSIWSWLSSWF